MCTHDMYAPRQSHAVTQQLPTCVLYCFCFFLVCFFGVDVSFSEYIFVPLSFSLYLESTSYVFPFRMVFFYLVTTGWIFYISLICENSINQLIKQSGTSAFFRGTIIGSQSRIRESPHPTQVRTKLEEEGQHQGNSKGGRPQAVDG